MLFLFHIFFSLSLSLIVSLTLFLSLSQISLSFLNLLNALGQNLSLFSVACTHLLFSCLNEHPFVNCFSTFFGGAKKTFQFLLSLVCSQTKDEKTNRKIKTTICVFLVQHFFCVFLVQHFCENFVSKILI